MKSKLLCLALALSGCFNIVNAQDKPDWSPVKMTMEIGGTVAVPPKYQQKLNLPEIISFNIKIDSNAERIPNTERSKATINYLIVLKNVSTNLVYLDMTNTISGEVNGVPQQAEERIRKPALDSLTDALKKFIYPDKNFFQTPTNAITFSTNALATPTNDIVIEKLKFEENGSKVFGYPKSP